MSESAHLQGIPPQLRLIIYRRLINKAMQRSSVHRTPKIWSGAAAVKDFYEEVMLPFLCSTLLTRELRAELHNFTCPILILSIFDLRVLDLPAMSGYADWQHTHSVSFRSGPRSSHQMRRANSARVRATCPIWTEATRSVPSHQDYTDLP